MLFQGFRVVNSGNAATTGQACKKLSQIQLFLQSRCSNLTVIIIQTQITLNDRSQPWKFNNSTKFINTCGRSNSVIITGKIAHKVPVL